MKKLILLLSCIVIQLTTNAQNIVPNGDFELHSGCPTATGQFDSVSNWINPSFQPYGTPDYFNQCCTSSYASVPLNSRGWQNAHSGNAYCGIVIARGVTNLDYREYIEVPMKSSMLAGTCYHFEMYMSLGDESEFTSDAIQVYFSDTLVSGIANYNPLPFTPQISNTAGNIPDVQNWTLVSGNYTATGTENYMIIGNFHNSGTTSITNLNNSTFSQFAFVFIDDVSLVPCEVTTGINESVQNAQVKLSPNPTTGVFIVVLSGSVKNASIEIYDMLGALVYSKQTTSEVNPIELTDHADGIYFIKVMSDNKILAVQKIIKQ